MAGSNQSGAYNAQSAADSGQSAEELAEVIPIARFQKGSVAAPSDQYKMAKLVPLKASEPATASTSQGANMADQTREEVDAKLAAAEARSETRFVELSGKIDRVIDAVGRANADYVQVAGDLRAEMQLVKADNKFTRTTIIATIVASILAGLAALWVTQSNILASFQAGISLHESSSAHSPTLKPTEPTPSPSR